MTLSHQLKHGLMALVMLIFLMSTALAQTIVGPGTIPGTDAMVSEQKAGSVLFFLYYQSNSTTPGVNTRINITNTHLELSAFVHVFFFSSCTPADAYVCLTPNQTISVTSLDYDPDSRGYVAAIAVDGGSPQVPGTGCPVRFNWLIGDEFIKTKTIQATLNAEAVAARFGVNDNDRIGGPACKAGDLTANLVFDGSANGYDKLGSVLAIDNFPSRIDGYKVRITVVSLGTNEDFAISGGSGGTLTGVIYDERGQPFSFTLSMACSEVSEIAPRTLFSIDEWIGSGQTGWARLWLNKKALLGAVFITNFGTGSNAFTGGHTLHKLTLAPTATVTIPLFVPAC